LTAIQSRFPRVAYFLAWNDDWSPIRNQNANSFFNNPRVVNRGQIGSSNGGGGGGGTTTSSGSVILYNFSNGLGQWKGTFIAAGPWQSNEMVVKSTDSLKADIRLVAGRQYTLSTQEASTIKLSGRKRLTAQVRAASWGFSNGGTLSVKLFVKTGSGWTWSDSGPVQLNSGATATVTLDLTKIAAGNLADGKEVGVEFTSNNNGAQTSIYLSSITAES
jgi:mannan endo-1,4-beta-mannosidase